MKESVFISIIKSFFKGFFFILGIFLAFIPLILITGSFLQKEEKPDITILPDLEGNTKILPQKAPAILKINIHGIIGEKHLTTDVIENILIESRKDFFKNNKTKAILLHVSSPGGGVTDSDGIYRALKRYKETYSVPVYAYVDGICASGAFYISAIADKIYSSPTSIIGSVGVILGPFFNVSKTLEKLGVETQTLTDGKDKDMMNPLRPWKKTEADNLKTIGAFMYQRFVSIISSNRNIPKNLILQDYGAHIFDASKAEKIGYIDHADSSFQKVVKDLLEHLNIKEPFQLVEIEPKKKWADFFTKNSLLKGKIRHKLHLPCNIKKRELSYLYVP